MTWASILATIQWVGKGIVSLFAYIDRQESKAHGKLEANEEGRGHVENMRDHIDNADPGIVPDDEVIRRDP